MTGPCRGIGRLRPLSVRLSEGASARPLCPKLATVHANFWCIVCFRRRPRPKGDLKGAQNPNSGKLNSPDSGTRGNHSELDHVES